MNDDKEHITEGQGLFLMIVIFFGGTFLLNAIVYGFIGRLVFSFMNIGVVDQSDTQKSI